MPQPLDYPTCQKMVMNYLCSGCWEHLVPHIAPEGKYYAKCVNCGDETPGYVTKWWVERQEEESYFEKTEVLRGYPELRESKKMAEESIDELGF